VHNRGVAGGSKHICLSVTLSLSLSVYIYIYIYTYTLNDSLGYYQIRFIRFCMFYVIKIGFMHRDARGQSKKYIGLCFLFCCIV
jgi:hypothetical protein